MFYNLSAFRLGRNVACDCGIPWTFPLPFFICMIYTAVVFIERANKTKPNQICLINKLMFAFKAYCVWHF